MLGQALQLLLEPLDVGHVARERLLGADRDRLRGQVEPPRVDPARAVAQQRAELAREQAAQLLVLERREGTDRLDPAAAEPLLRARADARQATHRKRRKE